MGYEAFLEPPGMSGLQPCAQTHLKKALVLYSLVWWGARQIDNILSNHY